MSAAMPGSSGYARPANWPSYERNADGGAARAFTLLHRSLARAALPDALERLADDLVPKFLDAVVVRVGLAASGASVDVRRFSPARPGVTPWVTRAIELADVVHGTSVRNDVFTDAPWQIAARVLDEGGVVHGVIVLAERRGSSSPILDSTAIDALIDTIEGRLHELTPTSSPISAR